MEVDGDPGPESLGGIEQTVQDLGCEAGEQASKELRVQRDPGDL